MKKRIVTVFPQGKNIHLIKDVGMVPYMLQKEGYYQSTIAFYQDKKDLPYLKSELNDISYKKISKIFKSEELNIFVFLLKNLFVFDVVMMFHPNSKKLLFAYIVKIITMGKTHFYFKMDVDERVYSVDFEKETVKNKIRNFLCNKNFLYTVETREVDNFFNRNTSIKSKWLPNGFYHNPKELTNLDNKENIILTVGRIGTFQKDTETLLKALENINLRNWQVHIVGPIEENFDEKIIHFYQNNPNLKQKVKFLGNIDDRKTLRQQYEKAKLFVLTSRYESFGLVLVEAMASGCYIISTNLASAKDITNNGEYGKLFPIEDSKALSSILQNIIDEKIQLPDVRNIVKFAEKNFNWKIIVRKLHNYLENKE
ncbi:glycosyltransferase [Capnocytophaga canimorsus]|uniref:glycosyltransferase n=1 Tax=Capnocytophaga canimorsus TaxID=28188 RepID=UPI00385A86AA